MTEPSSLQNNTYFIDTEDAAEMARLVQLDMFMTDAMGGPLAEQPDPSRFQCVLDLACGPGGWALDVAHRNPGAEVAGIDVSKTMTDYANARARSQCLVNATFGVMNVTQPLDFSDHTFDLVNARLMVAFLHRDTWPQLMCECARITRPGGVLRLTELDVNSVTTSSAFDYLDLAMVKALSRAGKGFATGGRTCSITPMLPTLLRNAGYQNIQTRPHALEWSAGSPLHMTIYRNYEIVFKLTQSFILGQGVSSQEELDRAYQRVLIEMLQDDFKAIMYLLTVWGNKPA